MADYSWIQPGVRAEIIGSVHCPAVVGAVVTIKAPPREFISSDFGKFVGVELYESEFLITLLLGEKGRIYPLPEHLKKLDDNRFEIGSWEKIYKAIGSDFRNVVD